MDPDESGKSPEKTNQRLRARGRPYQLHGLPKREGGKVHLPLFFIAPIYYLELNVAKVYKEPAL
jgi:hypothetical protein